MPARCEGVPIRSAANCLVADAGISIVMTGEGRLNAPLESPWAISEARRSRYSRYVRRFGGAAASNRKSASREVMFGS